MKLFLSLFFLNMTLIFSQNITVEVEDMTFSGFAGVINSPFNGGGFYANSDGANILTSQPTVPGVYELTLIGASSNTTSARIDVKINGVKVGVFNFETTSPIDETQEIIINADDTNLDFQLQLTTDTGSNDTFIDSINLTYLGVIPPPRPDPIIPSQSAFDSGIYRNMFVESGVSEALVNQKMDAIWNQFFVNGDLTNERLFYNVGLDMAYILDTGNDDIRSEGQSYGMMICVQLNKKEQFDKLWKWAKIYSQFPPGDSREGLFSWQIDNDVDFTKRDFNSAPDGEEYFVTALFFADAIWGSQEYPGPFNPETDIYDYKGQANYILDSMLNKPLTNSGGCPTNLINLDEKQIVFGICGGSATFTDPSYHLPAFYDIWAEIADNNNQLWLDMAEVSRTYLLPAASNDITGLMPDYSTFEGVPTGSQQTFAYDSWRNIMNMAFDFNWFQKESEILQTLIDNQINFFIDQGPGYGDRYQVDGFRVGYDHSPGLVATNAVAALAATDTKIWPFVDELFDTPIPSGRYRYYNGLLYMMSFMHLAGEFKALTGNDPLTVNENELNSKLKIYPNPTADILYLKADQLDLNAVSIYSVTGQLVYQSNDDFENINFINYSKGIYFLEIQTDKGKINRRVLKK